MTHKNDVLRQQPQAKAEKVNGWWEVSVPVGNTTTSVSVAKTEEEAWQKAHKELNKSIQLNDPKLGKLSGIFVEGEDVETAIAFVYSLIQNQQIEPSPGATHSIQTDDQGRRCLVRKRFSFC